MNTTKMTKIAFCFASSLLLAMPAVAGTWTRTVEDVSYEQIESRRLRVDLNKTADTVSFRDNSRSSLGMEFSCLNGDLFSAVRVSDESPVIHTALTTEAFGYLTVPRRVAINDKPMPVQYFMPSRDDGLFLTYDPKLSRKMYNSVVRGQDFTFNYGGGKAFTLSPPTVNADFADFGKNCGLGRNAVK